MLQICRNEKVFAILTAHIIRQRNKKVEHDTCLLQEGHAEKDVGNITAIESGQLLSAKSFDEHYSPVSAVKEPEEAIEDIEQQIENYQKKLESLKEEKHVLFQELKKVLHDEDERKKHKELEEKRQNDGNIQSDLDKTTSGSSNAADCKPVAAVTNIVEQHLPFQSQPQPGPLQQQQPPLEKATTGMKRSLPTSPEPIYAADSLAPLAKHHRGPLLPNPDTPIMFGRSGVPYMGGARRPYGPRSHYGGGPRQAYHDLRFGQAHMHIQDIHNQGLPPPCPITPTTPRTMSFPHLSTVPEFHAGIQNFQFTSNPQLASYVSTDSCHQVGQPTIQGSYISKHPPDVQGQHNLYSPDMHLQLQSSDQQLQVQTFGHQDSPHFMCQPASLFGDYIQSGAYLGIDPRQQKLEQPSKLESPPHSPVCSSRKHSMSRGLSLS